MQEALSRVLEKARIDERRSVTSSRGAGASDIDEILESRSDIDAIRARGILKYTYNYTPVKDVDSAVVAEVRTVLHALGRHNEDPANLRFGRDNDLKFKARLIPCLTCIDLCRP